MIQADIITIGDELLIGQVLDTNSAWIASRLNEFGISVRQMLSVVDTKEAISTSVQSCLNDVSNIILVTGGLGPTKDDITKHTLAQLFGCSKWIVHEPTLAHISSFFEKRGIAMNELNKKQAELPNCCKPIFNAKGTAPGMWFAHENKVIVSMPGVPFEMKAMLANVLPMLQQQFQLDDIYHKTMLTYGIPESTLAETIEAWEDALPNHLKLAYLPSPELGVRLRISAYGNSKQQLEQEVKSEFSKLLPVLQDSMYGWDEESLEVVVGKLLKNRGEVVATAESCTGGAIASRLTKVPGCSAYYTGSVVAYANHIKEAVLGVKASDLEQHGAVSKQVVEQMALGAKSTFKSDYSIATSGIAGPDGGTDEKPVGTVWIAVATPLGVLSEKHWFNHERELVIRRSTAVALNMLRLAIIRTRKEGIC